MTMTTARAIPTEVLVYLDVHHVITVSSPSFTGMPHADTVVYVNDDAAIYFVVVTGSMLARNIRDSRYVAFTIDDYLPDWRKLRELQGVGRCEVVEPSACGAITERVRAKFGPTFAPPPGRMHRLTPVEMHFNHYGPNGALSSGAVRHATSIADGAVAPVATSLDRLVAEPGQVLFRTGERSGHCYVVVEGLVEVRREGFGADQTVTFVRPGQMFGDATADDGPGALTAVAVEPTVLLLVERDAWRELAVHPDR